MGASKSVTIDASSITAPCSHSRSHVRYGGQSIILRSVGEASLSEHAPLQQMHAGRQCGAVSALHDPQHKGGHHVANHLQLHVRLVRRGPDELENERCVGEKRHARLQFVKESANKVQVRCLRISKQRNSITSMHKPVD